MQLLVRLFNMGQDGGQDGAGRSRLPLEPTMLNPLRLAWHARNAWHRVARPLTMGVRAIILDGDGRVLLIRHSYVPGWHLPGGGVDKGETLAEAMRREVREEVGLTVGEARPLGVYLRLKRGASDHVGVFVAEAWSGTPKVDRFELVDAAFFPLDRLPEDTTPATLRRLAEFREKAPISEHW